jgi:hypothetical protein
MPSSSYSVIPAVLDLVTTVKPRTILDIGIGFGKYGALFREYLDLWDTSTGYDEKSVILTGVEVCERYRSPLWGCYDEIAVGNILELPEIPGREYDLIFMGDVIEHLHENEAVELLQKLRFTHLLIVTPLNVSEQGAVYDNERERHVSEWRPDNLPGAQYMVLGNQQIFYYYNERKHQ